MKVYILQVHEDATTDADEIDVFGSLKEGAEAYNKTIEDINDIYGTDDFPEDSFLSPDYVKAFEGKDCDEAYEVPAAGCTHVINLFSRDI